MSYEKNAARTNDAVRSVVTRTCFKNTQHIRTARKSWKPYDPDKFRVKNQVSTIIKLKKAERISAAFSEPWRNGSIIKGRVVKIGEILLENSPISGKKIKEESADIAPTAKTVMIK